MYGPLRSLLFRADPERAHRLANLALAPLQHAPWSPVADPRLSVSVLGSTFGAPLGIAAGFDKQAHVYNALLRLGFGHVEVGTVTPRPQPGNPRPRIERHPDVHALVNRMGFPGPGAAAVAHALARTPPAGPVGANIGPNKHTPANEVGADLALCAAALAPHIAYLAINVSSPNTPGLRALQEPAVVARLVAATQDAAADAGHPRPVLLKLHPDAADEELVAVARAAVGAGASGIIATNTTRARPEGMVAMDGGLSGRPLAERARQAIQALHLALPDTPIIGVGGIEQAEDAIGHLRAGATLVQAYTGFVYQGPAMARRIHRGILDEMDRRGIDRIDELVGSGIGA